MEALVLQSFDFIKINEKTEMLPKQFMKFSNVDLTAVII